MIALLAVVAAETVLTGKLLYTGLMSPDVPLTVVAGRVLPNPKPDSPTVEVGAAGALAVVAVVFFSVSFLFLSASRCSALAASRSFNLAACCRAGTRGFGFVPGRKLV